MSAKGRNKFLEGTNIALDLCNHGPSLLGGDLDGEPGVLGVVEVIYQSRQITGSGAVANVVLNFHEVGVATKRASVPDAANQNSERGACIALVLWRGQ